VTGDFDGDVACAAATLGASCLPKPFGLEDLGGWLLHALGSPVQPAGDAPAVPDEERLLARLTETMLDQLDARYEFGQHVHRLRYGSGAGDAAPPALVALAKKTGLEPASLRRMARVTEVIRADEFAEYRRLRTPRGVPLSWSCFEELSVVRGRPRRFAIAQLAARDELSIRELRAACKQEDSD